MNIMYLLFSVVFLPFLSVSYVICDLRSGADPGFWDTGLKCSKGEGGSI